MLAQTQAIPDWIKLKNKTVNNSNSKSKINVKTLDKNRISIVLKADKKSSQASTIFFQRKQ